MKLINSLKKLILEYKSKNLKFPIIRNNGRRIKVFFSKHQTVQRFGDADVEDISTIKIINTMLNTQWRTGVPNIWIYESIVKNFDIVFETIDELYDPNLTENVVIFSAPHDQLEEFEFVCGIESFSPDSKGLTVVTSGVPTKRRRYFLNLKKSPQIKLTEEESKKIIKVRLEN